MWHTLNKLLWSQMLTVDSCKHSFWWLICKPNNLCVETEKAVYSLSVLSYMLCTGICRADMKPEYFTGAGSPWGCVLYVSFQNVHHKIHVIDIKIYSMITHLTWITRCNLFSFSWSWTSIVYLLYFFKTPVLVVRRFQWEISAEE